MHHYVYKITNLITDEYYIGKHSSQKLYDNYMGGGKKIKEAILKYGVCNFRKDVIKSFWTSTEAFEYEFECLKQCVSDVKCYNIDACRQSNQWLTKYK